MSITLLNQTHCAICGNIITKVEDLYSFSPFIQNVKDPLFYFSDSSFHSNCTYNHPNGYKAIEYNEIFINKIRPENRICIVGGNKILKYNNYIFVDLLTSEEKEELHYYSFLTFDRSNLDKWKDRNLFISLAIQFINQGKWEDIGTFKYLDNLIKIFSL